MKLWVQGISWKFQDISFDCKPTILFHKYESPGELFFDLARLHHCNLSLSWVTSEFLLEEKLRSQVIDIVHNFVS